MNRLHLLSFSVLLLACSKEDTKNDSEAGTDSGIQDTGSGMDGAKPDTGVQDAGVTDTSTQDTGADSGIDAGFLLEGCTDNAFVDKTGNQTQRTIDPWNLTQSTPICIIIQQNQSVVWNANPSFQPIGGHPLGPSSGGDMPNPITATASGTTVAFAFPNTGNYGFRCQNHPSTMRGVIRVKP